MKKPRIIQAADAVAYLPLYVAEQANYRVRLPSKRVIRWADVFGQAERVPPDEYLDHINEPSAREGDRGCLNAIYRAWKRDKQPLIGICDPLDIERLGYKGELVIVAGFIRKPCFWCLTDTTVTGSRPADLYIDALFSHIDGFSTGQAISQDIGNRISQKSPNFGHYYGSFDLLVDGAVWFKNQLPDRRVAVISASIVSCILAESRGFRIAFPISDVEGYDAFFTTGIVIHRECLKDLEIKDALILLFVSMKEAVRQLHINEGHSRALIKNLCDDPKRFVQERTIDSAKVNSKHVECRQSSEHSLAFITHEQVEKIYDSLITSSIYSSTGYISLTEWSNAWSIRHGSQTPHLADFFDDGIIRASARAVVVGTERKVGQHAGPWRDLAWYGGIPGLLAIAIAVTVCLILGGTFLTSALSKFLAAPNRHLSNIIYTDYLAAYEALIIYFGVEVQPFIEIISAIGVSIVGLAGALLRKTPMGRSLTKSALKRLGI